MNPPDSGKKYLIKSIYCSHYGWDEEHCCPVWDITSYVQPLIEEALTKQAIAIQNGLFPHDLLESRVEESKKQAIREFANDCICNMCQFDEEQGCLTNKQLHRMLKEMGITL